MVKQILIEGRLTLCVSRLRIYFHELRWRGRKENSINISKGLNVPLFLFDCGLVISFLQKTPGSGADVDSIIHCAIVLNIL